MIILSIDSAVTGCSVGLWNSATDKQQFLYNESDRRQAELLVSMVDETVQNFGITYQDIGAVAVTLGPGSFTGVRVALSTARALGLALDIPVWGVTTLDIIAAQHLASEKLLVLVDTKRGDFYGQIFDEHKNHFSEMRIWNDEEIQNFNDGVIVRDVIPDVIALAKFAFEQQSAQVDPIYIRGAEVSMSKTIPPHIIK